MITYRKMQIKGEETSISGLWYARPVISDTLDTAALAKHMSKHNTPFSPGVIFQGVGTRQGAEAACPCHGRTE